MVQVRVKRRTPNDYKESLSRVLLLYKTLRLQSMAKQIEFIYFCWRTVSSPCLPSVLVTHVPKFLANILYGRGIPLLQVVRALRTRMIHQLRPFVGVALVPDPGALPNTRVVPRHCAAESGMSESGCSGRRSGIEYLRALGGGVVHVGRGCGVGTGGNGVGRVTGVGLRDDVVIRPVGGESGF